MAEPVGRGFLEVAGRLRDRFGREEPGPALRAMLLGEGALYTAALLSYTCLLLPSDGVRWFDPAFYVFFGLFPIAMNLLHGDIPADSGIRLDNLGRSAWQVGLASAAMASGLVIAGLAVDGFHAKSAGRVAQRFGEYVGWGMIQQYILQAFLLRRLLQAGLPKTAAILPAATLFALVHAPNWVLVGLTFGAGLAWCQLFLAAPNLLALGLSHAGLATLAYHALPEAWLRRLTIGGIYLKEVGGG